MRDGVFFIFFAFMKEVLIKSPLPVLNDRSLYAVMLFRINIRVLPHSQQPPTCFKPIQVSFIKQKIGSEL